MKRNAILLLAGLLAVGLIAAGCGDDDDNGDGGEALTKEEFLAQGNQICDEGNAASDAAEEETFGSGGEPTQAEQDAFITDTLVPNIQGQIDDLRALEPPEGDEDTISGILDSAESTLGELEADPSVIQGGGDPFTAVNKQLNDYGLTSCGSSS